MTESVSNAARPPFVLHRRFLDYVDTCQKAECLLFLQGSQERRGSAWLHCWRHRASVRGLFHSKAPMFKKCLHNIETPFEHRFQGILRQAWKERSWHVIAAVPGSGKSLGIADFFHQSGAYKDTTGTTRLPILAIRAPKNATREQALGMVLSAAFGVIPSMPWAQRRIWLVHILASTEVECIIIDDAQDLHLSHLALLKELTDNLAAPPYERQVGLCLVAAHSGNVMPLKETFARPDVLWKQFRHRMALINPYCIVSGHTEEEVRHISTSL